MPGPVNWQDRFDDVDRLKTIHDLFVAVQAWSREEVGSSRKLAYDKLAVLHEQAIAHFANN